MSDKKTRGVAPSENTDEKRFRKILKESEDIMKTAYPSEEDSTQKDSINPFVEEVPPKNKLSADFAPDGKVLIDDNPEKKKADKARARDEKRNTAKLARQNRRREKLLVRIKKMEPRLILAQEEKNLAEGTVRFEKYRKKEVRIAEKLADLRQRAVSAEQFTPDSGFYIKAHTLKIWVVVLVFLVAVIIALSTVLITATYRDLAHYRGDSATQRESVNKLSGQLQTAKEEKASAADEVSVLTEKIATLEKAVEDTQKENDKLSPKANFLDDHILIVNGSLFKKVYHKHGCSKINYSSFKAYNKEQVQGKLGFFPCPNCIK